MQIQIEFKPASSLCTVGVPSFLKTPESLAAAKHQIMASQICMSAPNKKEGILI